MYVDDGRFTEACICIYDFFPEKNEREIVLIRRILINFGMGMSSNIQLDPTFSRK